MESDKPKDRTTMTVRLPTSLYERLKELAYQQRMSLNQLCVELLSKARRG